MGAKMRVPGHRPPASHSAPLRPLIKRPPPTALVRRIRSKIKTEFSEAPIEAHQLLAACFYAPPRRERCINGGRAGQLGVGQIGLRSHRPGGSILPARRNTRQRR